MIPGIVVYLVKDVVVAGIGITGGSLRLAVDGERFVVVLRQEIIAVIRIRIARVYGSLCRIPYYGADTIEDTLAAHRARRHLFQVIGLCEIITCQTLGLQGSTVTIDLHLREIRETCLLHKRTGQLVEAVVGDTDLHPFAFPQHRVVGIAVAGRCGPRHCLA